LPSSGTTLRHGLSTTQTNAAAWCANPARACEGLHLFPRHQPQRQAQQLRCPPAGDERHPQLTPSTEWLAGHITGALLPSVLRLRSRPRAFSIQPDIKTRSAPGQTSSPIPRSDHRRTCFRRLQRQQAKDAAMDFLIGLGAITVDLNKRRLRHRSTSSISTAAYGSFGFGQRLARHVCGSPSSQQTRWTRTKPSRPGSTFITSPLSATDQASSASCSGNA